MRVLLDEHFPDPPGFDPASLDAHLDVTSLREHDRTLVGNRIPDWYLYLVAHEGRFDALVTRDWRQSAQVAEMWVATRTDVSVIAWRAPQADPVVEWAQLVAYMPHLRRLHEECGPSVLLLPTPALSSSQHVEKATDRLGILASEQGRARQELIDEARAGILAWLDEHGLAARHARLLGL